MDDYILVRPDALAAESGALQVTIAAVECTRGTSSVLVHPGAVVVLFIDKRCAPLCSLLCSRAAQPTAPAPLFIYVQG